MTQPVLDCENLTYVDNTGVVFQDLHFSLDVGQSALILAEPHVRARGLLSVWATLSPPTSGRIRWFGGTKERLNPTEILAMRKRIGFVHRSARLVSNMTIFDNIILGLLYHHNVTPREAENQVQEIMERYGLLYSGNLRPADVPFETRRLALYVREMVKKPSLYLLDDPASDLDTDFESIISDLFNLTRRGEAALIFSHIAASVGQDRVDWVLFISDAGNRFMAKSSDDWDDAISGPNGNKRQFKDIGAKT